MLPKIRTMKEAYRIMEEADPDTSLSYYMFRALVMDGVVPSLKTGGRYLINLNDLETMFSRQYTDAIADAKPEHPGIRPIFE
jgi:hypothetical protein